MNVSRACAALSLGFVLTGCVVVTQPDPAAQPGAPQNGSAPASDWQHLGSVTANGKNDHDNLMVGRSRGTFQSIRLTVEDSAVELHDLVVEFEDGTSFSPKTRLVFDRGSHSRQIDLPGGKRAIKRVGVRFSDRGGVIKGVVHVWAH